MGLKGLFKYMSIHMTAQLKSPPVTLNSSAEKAPRIIEDSAQRINVTAKAYAGFGLPMSNISVTIFARPSFNPGAGAGIGINDSTEDRIMAVAVITA
jgi:hypothetical protein